MNNYQNRQNETPNANCLDVNFEQKLLASQLVSEVHRSTGHVSFTFTDAGVLAFAKAMQLAALEEHPASESVTNNLFPDSNGSLISKKDAMLGFNVSHTTLWKWQKSGYLTPVKVGKRIYYRREDIMSLTQK